MKKIFVLVVIALLTSPNLGFFIRKEPHTSFRNFDSVRAESSSIFNITSWFQSIGTVGEAAWCITTYGDRLYAAGRTDNPVGEDRDLFVVSLVASDGSVDWFTRIGTDEQDKVYGIVAASGRVFVVGDIEDYPFLGCLSSHDGSLLWSKHTPGPDTYRDIVLYGDSLFITGYAKILGLEYVLVTAFSLDGTLKWSRTFGGGRGNELTAFRDKIYVTGYTYTAGGADAFLACLFNNGSLDWIKTIGGSESDYGVAVAGYGDNIYVYGHTMSFNPSWMSLYTIPLHLFVTSFSISTGNLQWFERVSIEESYPSLGGIGGSHDWANDMIVHDDTIYLVGRTENHPGPSPSYYDEGFVTALSAYDGSLQWSNILSNDSLHTDEVFGIDVYNDPEYGDFLCITGGGQRHEYGWWSDIFVAKLFWGYI